MQVAKECDNGDKTAAVSQPFEGANNTDRLEVEKADDNALSEMTFKRQSWTKTNDWSDRLVECECVVDCNDVKVAAPILPPPLEVVPSDGGGGPPPPPLIVDDADIPVALALFGLSLCHSGRVQRRN